MKKITLFIGLTILLINFKASGQENETKFGIKAGLNYSNFILGKEFPSDFPANFNGKIGFHVGGFLKLKLTNDLILKPELIFSKQGAEFEIDLGSLTIDPDPLFADNYKTDIKESLFLLPIMLDYYFNESFDIEFGPQLGYVISQNISTNNETATINSAYKNYDKFEIGLNLGLGYNFAKIYRIGIRYNYGIMERNNRKSSVFQLGLQYQI